eukprot:NODE_12869_length_1199_cov_1.935634.p1 GENE.NODE_12869_length_1199_cov_1.935634~~NODE_12869_length_1199_cov_1.935634.p1  ORF type:complete len:314 (-),score=117.53 NODE_12869_length_1199_cov_1.935634:209-1150(-)
MGKRKVTAALLASLCVGVGHSSATPEELEFMKVDTNGNGQLSVEEFTYWLEHRKRSDFFDFHEASDPVGSKIPGDFRESVKLTEATTQNFWTAFINSVAMIIVTELGDKTFFIAAILAMRHSPVVVFLGAVAALAVMTVLGAIIGFALPVLLPRQYTHYAAMLLFLYFGLKLLKEGTEMARKGEGTGPSDELEEVEQQLKEKDEDVDASTCEAGGSVACSGKANPHRALFWQAFTLTFLAEWGDRSQIATIALASAKDPTGVTAGGIIGHSLCTGLAVTGGKVIAGKISERTVLIIGGALFLCFAVHALVAGP